jgi:predicted NBD/HSP70 family sugar kinase
MSFMVEKNYLHRKKILKELYFNQKLSCAELSEKTDKSIPVTTKILTELEEEGYVIDTGFAPSTGGRRPLMYSIRPEVMYIISVAMDQFITRIALMDMQNIYVTDVEKFELSLARNKQALPVLAQHIDRFIKKTGIDKKKIIGIGVGMPGFIDAKKGMNYSFLETDKKNITTYISDVTELPVFIDNDSSLIALAELRFGAAHHKKNAMVVNIGWGIGLGMILNGQLFRGHNGFAGEFSHIPLFTNDKLCSCGKSGCLETETSLLVITEKAKDGLKTGRASMLQHFPMEGFEESSESILKAASNGDQYAVEILSSAGYNIGRGVAILIHILNPEIIILSGRGSIAGKIWQAPIQQAINQHCIPRIAANTVIEISTLGYHAELIGAAALVMENYENKELKNKHHNSVPALNNQ